MSGGVSLQGLVKRFGAVTVIERIDLAVEPGEFLVLLGESGCGKSTLLRMIAGLETVTEGRIAIDGRDVTHTAPMHRDIAMVFQNYALYPHMNVAQNMSFALRLARRPAGEIEQKVRQAARVLNIERLLERKPRELSGGQRQRVAIGRAIVREPTVFLFDEPLSNLDAKLRGHMRSELALLHGRLGKTTIYVTHDQVEAMTLASRIVIFDEGRVQQVGPPSEVFASPANVFVAGFIGTPTINLFDAAALPAGDLLRLRGAAGDWPLPPGLALQAGQAVKAGIRPQALRLATGAPLLRARVDIVEFLGTETVLTGRAAGDDSQRVCAVLPGNAVELRGREVGLEFDAADLHLFDAASGRRLAHCG